VERRLGITHDVLEAFVETRHPVMIVTRSALIERDIDRLTDLARDGLAQVAISMTSLDLGLSQTQTLERRAAPPRRRLRTIDRLTTAGAAISVLIAPVIPALPDQELEKILEAVRKAGALEDAYVLLRLPRAIRELFEVWLRVQHPLKADDVVQRICDCHGAKEYDSPLRHPHDGRRDLRRADPQAVSPRGEAAGFPRGAGAEV
jgi:DNA repair photolyase